MTRNSSDVRGIDSNRSLLSKIKQFPVFFKNGHTMPDGTEFIVSHPFDTVSFQYTVHELNPLIDSSEMRTHSIMQIHTALHCHYNNFDYFIIIHGTDTMEHSASALSFLIKGNTKPIILTGSQVPLVFENNDAYNNLYNSFAALGELISEKPGWRSMHLLQRKSVPRQQHQKD